VAASRPIAESTPRRKGFGPPPPPEEKPATNYALRLTEALDAIRAADNPPRVGNGRREAAREGLPPIRLPLGPPIPWRIGVPLLVGLSILWVVFFVVQPRTITATPVIQPTPVTTAPDDQAQLGIPDQPSIGVQDPPGTNFDVLDLGLKLVAVLALVYGSLLVLKRTGVLGASAARMAKSGATDALRVVSSVGLAPNRSVHLIRVPGERALLVGATPQSINLLADLGALPETDTPDSASFFEVLKDKLT
jgi:flagellar biogenesis protein FliO